MLFSLVKSFAQNLRLRRLSPEQVKRHQEREFRKLVAYVNQHSPYYRRIIHENKISLERCRPEDFPVLTKREVMEHFDEIVTDRLINLERVTQYLRGRKDPDELFLGRYQVIHTSGSTGAVGYAVYDQTEMARGLACVTFARRFGLFRKTAFIGATGGAFAGVTISSAASQAPLIYRSHHSFDVNMPFSELVAALNDLQPHGLSGYPFALRRLAEAQAKGTLRIRPKSIFLGGEALREPDKKLIQDVFGVPVLNVYASSEFLVMGLGLDRFDGMYLMDGNLIFEFHPQHLCVTNLFNRTLPLIRYQMNDQLQPIPDTARKLPFTKVAPLIGRESVLSSFLNDEDEEEFLSLQVMDSLAEKGIDGFQIQLIDKRRFILRFTVDSALPDEIKSKLAVEVEAAMDAFLREKKMTRVRYDLEQKEALKHDTNTGKFRSILSPASTK